jgi:hypothetical protein
MNGVEMMLSNLLGIKPAELRAQVEQAIGLMKSGAEAAASIQSDLAKIKNHLGIDVEEVPENVGRTAIANGHANNQRIEL